MATKPDVPFMDISTMMESMQVPGVNMNALMEARRKDVEALIAANQQTYAGMQAMAQHQAKIMQETMQQWQSAAASVMSGKNPAEGIGQQGEMAQQAFQKAIVNMRELAEIAARSQTEAWQVVSKRVQENIEEMRKLTRTK